ncbi:unnamed protein product [Calypogeia fissa]
MPRLSLATEREANGEGRANGDGNEQSGDEQTTVTGHHGQVGARKDGVGHNDGVRGSGRRPSKCNSKVARPSERSSPGAKCSWLDQKKKRENSYTCLNRVCHVA